MRRQRRGSTQIFLVLGVVALLCVVFLAVDSRGLGWKAKKTFKFPGGSIGVPAWKQTRNVAKPFAGTLRWDLGTMDDTTMIFNYWYAEKAPTTEDYRKYTTKLTVTRTKTRDGVQKSAEVHAVSLGREEMVQIAGHDARCFWVDDGKIFQYGWFCPDTKRVFALRMANLGKAAIGSKLRKARHGITKTVRCHASTVDPAEFEKNHLHLYLPVGHEAKRRSPTAYDYYDSTGRRIMNVSWQATAAGEMREKAAQRWARRVAPLIKANPSEVAPISRHKTASGHSAYQLGRKPKKNFERARGVGVYTWRCPQRGKDYEILHFQSEHDAWEFLRKGECHD